MQESSTERAASDSTVAIFVDGSMCVVCSFLLLVVDIAPCHPQAHDTHAFMYSFQKRAAAARSVHRSSSRGRHQKNPLYRRTRGAAPHPTRQQRPAQPMGAASVTVCERARDRPGGAVCRSRACYEHRKRALWPRRTRQSARTSRHGRCKQKVVFQRLPQSPPCAREGPCEAALSAARWRSLAAQHPFDLPERVWKRLDGPRGACLRLLLSISDIAHAWVARRRRAALRRKYFFLCGCIKHARGMMEILCMRKAPKHRKYDSGERIIMHSVRQAYDTGACFGPGYGRVQRAASRAGRAGIERNSAPELRSIPPSEPNLEPCGATLPARGPSYSRNPPGH